MTLDFQPLLPWPFIAGLALAAVLLSALGFWRGVRGAAFRTAALAALCLAIANPVFFQEEREPLSTIVGVVVDRSQSQDNAGRRAMTDQALATLKERLAKFPQIEARIVEAADDENTETPSTKLFTALQTALADVPPARVGGAIFITDGQIHDVPDINQPLGFDAPIHGLITGRPDEFDRRVEIVSGPRFGIVGEEQKVTFRIADDGQAPGGTAEVTVSLNGNQIATEMAEPGTDVPFAFTVPRGGNNILEFAVAPVDGEVTQANNRVAFPATARVNTMAFEEAALFTHKGFPARRSCRFHPTGLRATLCPCASCRTLRRSCEQRARRCQSLISRPRSRAICPHGLQRCLPFGLALSGSLGIVPTRSLPKRPRSSRR